MSFYLPFQETIHSFTVMRTLLICMSLNVRNSICALRLLPFFGLPLLLVSLGGDLLVTFFTYFFPVDSGGHILAAEDLEIPH